jgi:light-regulated signal transduction histidine kinase (bacteriophytochrome)
VVREPDLTIIQASANAAGFLGLPGPPLGPLLGQNLARLGGDLAATLRPHLDTPLDLVPVVASCRIGPTDRYTCLLHRTASAGLVIELEHAGPPIDLAGCVAAGLKAVLSAASLPALCDDTARIFREATGYDRVMVYRFDAAGHGEVIAEERRADLEALRGNRYPASDIPQIARRLYLRNRVRVLADIADRPIPLEPTLSPLTGAQLDMSLCFLRSVSPIHVQYLKNMGVRATLVASIVVGGKLWGLVACHHHEPRCIHFDLRAVCELLAEAVATRLTALESFAQGQAEIAVRRLEQKMIDAIARKGDWRSALFDNTRAILKPLGATGAALLLEGEVLTTGEVPGTPQLRDICAWLDQQAPDPTHAPVFVWTSFGRDVPRFDSLTPVASGLAAVRVSDSPGEYLLWFRPEQVRTLTWGGNPEKPAIIGNDPRDLSPRRSFAQWHQLVEGTAEAWSTSDLAAARLIGETVSDVVLQFRAVRTLIAQDQLAQVRRQVGQSDQPVIIGDEHGRILLANDAFQQLLTGSQRLANIADLADVCRHPAPIRERLHDLLANRRPWRGEIGLTAGTEAARSMMVRADPVFSAPDRLLGYVLPAINWCPAGSTRRATCNSSPCCRPSWRTPSWPRSRSPTASTWHKCPRCWRASAPRSIARLSSCIIWCGGKRTRRERRLTGDG